MAAAVALVAAVELVPADVMLIDAVKVMIAGSAVVTAKVSDTGLSGPSKKLMVVDTSAFLQDHLIA